MTPRSSYMERVADAFEMVFSKVVRVRGILLCFLEKCGIILSYISWYSVRVLCVYNLVMGLILVINNIIIIHTHI